jgi:hypothetical protein
MVDDKDERMSSNLKYTVNLYGVDDEFLVETPSRRVPKIGNKFFQGGEWLQVWYIEEIGDKIYNVRLERP